MLYLFKFRGQVWIETVVYTVIGLSLIALVLGFAVPKVNQAKDKLAVEQGIRSLQEIDEKINAVMARGDGNVRIVEVIMKRGNLMINTSENTIALILNNIQKPYSEVDVPIYIGPIQVISKKAQRGYIASLSIDYIFNITYAGEELQEPKIFTSAAIPYRFSITNLNNTRADIKEISQE